MYRRETYFRPKFLLHFGASHRCGSLVIWEEVSEGFGYFFDAVYIFLCFPLFYLFREKPKYSLNSLCFSAFTFKGEPVLLYRQSIRR